VDPAIPEFGGWSDFLPHPADIVVSASYNPLHLPLRAGVLHVRAEAWASNGEDAKAIADKLSGFLSMFHSAEASVGSPGTDADLKTLFDSLHVRQEDSRAVLVATLPTGVFRKLVDSPDEMPVVPSSSNAHEKAGKSPSR
jgi:hypothetical protein